LDRAASGDARWLVAEKRIKVQSEIGAAWSSLLATDENPDAAAPIPDLELVDVQGDTDASMLTPSILVPRHSISKPFKVTMLPAAALMIMALMPETRTPPRCRRMQC
jgi:hypothetical protein